jgi:hypothetical protein
MSKTDANVLKRGCKRMLLSLLTMMLFALAGICFYAVAISHGYLAVICFIAALGWLVLALTLLYAQGLTRRMHKESQGENK